jgi:hypothetical protein
MELRIVTHWDERHGDLSDEDLGVVLGCIEEIRISYPSGVVTLVRRGDWDEYSDRILGRVLRGIARIIQQSTPKRPIEISRSSEDMGAVATSRANGI